MNKLLIIRHAERPEISAAEVGNDVLLTSKGKVDSGLFVKLITKPILSIKTSPIGRCRQTAEIMAKTGNFAEEDIELSSMLGDPGFIIEDGDIAWQHWLEKGHDAVNQYLLSGIESWLGFNDLEATVVAVKEKIKTLLSNTTTGTHIWITHDTILATLASRLLNEKLTLAQWPEFLGYLECSLSDENQLLVNYQLKPNYF
jgi:broad specificity phosphatase PhoE